MAKKQKVEVEVEEKQPDKVVKEKPSVCTPQIILDKLFQKVEKPKYYKLSAINVFEDCWRINIWQEKIEVGGAMKLLTQANITHSWFVKNKDDGLVIMAS